MPSSYASPGDSSPPPAPGLAAASTRRRSPPLRPVAPSVSMKQRGPEVRGPDGQVKGFQFTEALGIQSYRTRLAGTGQEQCRTHQLLRRYGWIPRKARTCGRTGCLRTGGQTTCVHWGETGDGWLQAHFSHLLKLLPSRSYFWLCWNPFRWDSIYLMERIVHWLSSLGPSMGHRSLHIWQQTF